MKQNRSLEDQLNQAINQAMEQHNDEGVRFADLPHEERAQAITEYIAQQNLPDDVRELLPNAQKELRQGPEEEARAGRQQATRDAIKQYLTSGSTEPLPDPSKQTQIRLKANLPSYSRDPGNAW